MLVYFSQGDCIFNLEHDSSPAGPMVEGRPAVQQVDETAAVERRPVSDKVKEFLF